MSNPNHVLLKRQSSGERDAWDWTVPIESDFISNNTESHGDKDGEGDGDNTTLTMETIK